MARQWNENVNEACKALVEKYDVSDDKQESLNEVTDIWNNSSIRYTSKYPDIWSNEWFNFNLKLNKIRVKYDNYGDYIKAQVFDFPSKDYEPVRVSWNVNISIMAYKEPKK